jgi:hypothetical protein
MLTRLLSLPAESQHQLKDEEGDMIILKVIIRGENMINLILVDRHRVGSSCVSSTEPPVLILGKS